MGIKIMLFKLIIINFVLRIKYKLRMGFLFLFNRRKYYAIKETEKQIKKLFIDFSKCFKKEPSIKTKKSNKKRGNKK